MQYSCCQLWSNLRCQDNRECLSQGRSSPVTLALLRPRPPWALIPHGNTQRPGSRPAGCWALATFGSLPGVLAGSSCCLQQPARVLAFTAHPLTQIQFTAGHPALPVGGRRHWHPHRGWLLAAPMQVCLPWSSLACPLLRGPCCYEGTASVPRRHSGTNVCFQVTLTPDKEAQLILGLRCRSKFLQIHIYGPRLPLYRPNLSCQPSTALRLVPAGIIWTNWCRSLEAPQQPLCCETDPLRAPAAGTF